MKTLVIFILILFVFTINANNRVYANKGIIDLSNKNLEKNNYEINGEWEFYFNQLLEPGYFKENKIENINYIKVPYIWNDFIHNGKKIGSYGYATYRVRIITKDPGNYGLMINEINCAYKIWVNGELLSEIGKVGTNIDQSKPRWNRKEFFFYTTDKEIEIIIQVANFFHRKGGIEENIKIGKQNNILKEKYINLGKDFFLAGTLFIIFCFFMILFVIAKNEYSLLLFSLLNMAFFFRTITTNQKILINIIPEINWELAVKIEYCSIILGILFFSILINKLFYTKLNKFFLYPVIFINIILLTIVITTKTKYFSYTSPIISATGLFTLLYNTIYLIIYSAYTKDNYIRYEAILLITGNLILIFTGINDALYQLNILQNTIYITHIGVIIFFLIHSFILARRISKSLVNEIKLSKELIDINNTFKRFVPIEFLNFLEKDSIKDIKLGDQIEKNMTIFFSDIRDFTALSETMTPEENFNFLNSYFKKIAPIITGNYGVIDKFIGDAIMALFPEKPENAIDTAIKIFDILKKYNTKRKNKGYKTIEIGIGIHTGKMMLGTIGYKKRYQTTVISDTVNVASRLEQLTKVFKSKIIISADLFFNLNDPFKYHYRFLGNSPIKGKSAPVAIYEIFDTDQETIKELKIKTHTIFEQGVANFISGNYKEAKSFFEEVIKINPYDYASLHYYEEIDKKNLIKNNLNTL